MVSWDPIQKGAVMKISVVTTAIFALALSCLASSASESRVSDIHQSTTPPLDGRFEIVQSQLAAKWTFRLDRYTGYVDQLVKTQNNKVTWQKMPTEELPEISNPDRPRFVIFTSGIAARHTFLMDAQTGRTWILTTATSPSSGDATVDIVVWRPFQQ